MHVDKGGDFVHVLNTNLWNRTDVVFLDSMVNLNEKELITRTGEKVETQRLYDGCWAFVAENIPALSSEVYQIVSKKNEFKTFRFHDCRE